VTTSNKTQSFIQRIAQCGCSAPATDLCETQARDGDALVGPPPAGLKLWRRLPSRRSRCRARAPPAPAESHRKPPSRARLLVVATLGPRLRRRRGDASSPSTSLRVRRQGARALGSRRRGREKPWRAAPRGRGRCRLVAAR